MQKVFNEVERNNILYEKHIFKQIQSLVEKAKQVYKDDINKKRVWLKELLEFEDEQYEKEYKNVVQKRIESDIRKRQESLITIKNQHISEAKEFIRKKKAQQIIANSDDIRTMLSRNLLRETKTCQLLQIEENQKKLQKERENDLVWLEVQNRLAAADEEKQRYEDSIRFTFEKAQQAYNLNKTKEIEKMKSKNNEISDYHKGLGTLLRTEEIPKDVQYARKKKLHQMHLAELDKCSEQRRKLQEEIVAAERKFIDIINSQNKEEIKRLESMKSNQREIVESYIEYYENMKKEIAKQKAEENLIIEEQQKKLECEKLTKYLKIKEGKKQKAINTQTALMKQINDKDCARLKKTALDRAQRMAEKELIERENLRYLREEEVKKEKIAKYREELRKQMELQKCMENLRKENEYEFTRKINEVEKFNVQVAEKLLQDDKYLLTHPNWQLIDCSCRKPK